MPSKESDQPAEVVHIREVDTSKEHVEYIGRGPNGANMADTYIGDRGWLGNPYMLSENTQQGEYTREESIAAFRDAIKEKIVDDPAFASAVMGLRGKKLACWCRHEDEGEPPCHGDVIVEAIEHLHSLEGSEEPDL